MLNKNEINVLKQIIIHAGQQILNIKKKKNKIYSKNDNSPVTLADIQSNEIICNGLKSKFENISIISEENSSRKIEISLLC